MKLVKVERSGKTAEGFLEGEVVHVLGEWRDGAAGETGFGITRHPAGEWEALRGSARDSVPLSDVQLAVPLDPAAKILCVGMNYRDHVGEIKGSVSEYPVIFTRSLDSLSGHGAPIVRPKLSETFDFEGEIAVIIGKPGRHIRIEDALGHVSGYSGFMDGSVREYQRHSLTAGKNFHRTGSMGPWIVPASEIGERDIALATRLNGETVQSARASQMIFGIREIIAYVSRWTELRPGDVIATGTPGGVGSRRAPPLWMKAGDRIEVEVEGVGVLANPVIDEA